MPAGLRISRRAGSPASLHDVQRRVLVTHGVDRALEGAPIDLFQEVGEFLWAYEEDRFAAARSVNGRGIASA